MSIRKHDAINIGIVTSVLAFVVLLPLSALVWKAAAAGGDTVTATLLSPEARSALVFTIAASAVVALINAVAGTMVAWVLVRDDFRGRALLDAVIDLPFALPTVVAGLTLLSLYGPHSPVGFDITFQRVSVCAALLFVTFPFVVRAVQPVLVELDSEIEEAAASLGASPANIVRRVVLPTLLPAVLTGTGLSFAKAIGEFGS
ncbi:MAG: sulfate transporter, inner rane subunit CysT, partial [Thermoleophilia bacterium]|nr:sulfate transporter, inner rane subunit CysT [Thermoleophilia bacterium]